MKNFKRVISAVIALALSASTLVAVSAAKFTDVDSTNYAEAIDVLSALDVVHGYEDGSFKPDGEITRAEAATMIVGALNMMSDAQAAAGSSKFTDVNEKASWATGYVNVGVAQGFINGMDDTTFAPQENVTYAQMCVMLTLITGYGEYAKAYGGYPTGYTTMAATAGINKGVSLANDAKLKRGQVAQMIYNALTAPLLGVKSYSLAGNEYEPQDGSKGDFKTLLSDKFDSYAANIKIQAIANSDATLDNGEIKVSTTKATGEYFDNTRTAQVWNAKKVIDDYGITDALFTEGKAVLKYDDNKDEWHLVYFKASANSDSISLNAADYHSFADGGKSVDNGKITFGSKHYDVETGVGTIYVNGFNTGNVLTEANVSAVLDLAQGEVKFVDDNGTSGYEVIMVNVYDVAKVLAVTYANETTNIQVSPKVGLDTNISAIEITDDDLEDKDNDIKITNAEGEKVALSSIKKGDIIAYAYEPGSAVANKLESPKFIEIIVTDEKISGVVKGKDPTEETYTIDGETYSEVNWGDVDLKLGDTYSLALDPFGRIYEESLESSSLKYGIAEEYSNNELQVILGDGSYKWYELNGTSFTNKTGAALTAGGINVANNATGTNTDLKKYVNAGANTEKRVISYKVKNNGKIDNITFIAATGFGGTSGNPALTYKDKTSKLGSKSVIDSTAIVNIAEYKKSGLVGDYEKFAASSFVDKAEYEGFYFTQENDTTIAALILLTKIGDDINENTRFAVVKKEAQPYDANGEDSYKLVVLYEGTEQELLCTDTSGVDNLKTGDVIIFKNDANGFVKSYIKIFTASAYANNSFAAFSSLADLDGDDDGEINGSNAEIFNYDNSVAPAVWDYTVKNTAKADYQLVYGIVTEVTSSGSIEFYALNPAANGNIIDLRDDANYESYPMSADCGQYKYGMSEQIGAGNQYKAVYVAAPTESVISGYEVDPANPTTLTSKTDYYNLVAGSGLGYGQLKYALALIIDGDIVDIYTLAQ